MGGGKITIGSFLKIGFETKKYHFCILLDWIATEAILHPNFGKVIKTTQNVPKTVDNHKKTISFWSRKTILVILASKGYNTEFQDLEIGNADNKNALETPFLVKLFLTHSI